MLLQSLDDSRLSMHLLLSIITLCTMKSSHEEQNVLDQAIAMGGGGHAVRRAAVS